MRNKIVLAFSGGLDTSFAVLYLKEKGYDVITLTVDTGGLSKKKIKEIRTRSKQLGAKKHCFVDAKKEIFNEIISYLIKTNGLYQGIYPNMCADRYTIAKHLVKTAKKENTKVVSHGCTGAGNDQIRIDITCNCLNPKLEIIAPIRELGITRPEEIKYLKEKGFRVSKETKRYTINENIFGRTISGSEIDKNKEPSKEAWVLTKETKQKPQYFKIEFNQGIPVALNGKKMHGANILKKLNKEAGAHGYGRGLYIEDETIGIKGIQAFEAPGLLLLIKAHKALERLTLTWNQLSTKQFLDNTWANMAYRGLLHDPVIEDIQAFLNKNQKRVTGKVKIKLHQKTAFLTEVHSPNSLIREDIAKYAQQASWTGKEAQAFIKIYSLQQKIAASRKKEKKQ